MTTLLILYKARLITIIALCFWRYLFQGAQIFPPL